MPFRTAKKEQNCPSLQPFSVVQTAYFACFSLALISSPSIQKMLYLPLLFILSFTICLACASHKQNYFQKKMMMWLLFWVFFRKCHYHVVFKRLNLLPQWIYFFFNVHSKAELRHAFSFLITLVQSSPVLFSWFKSFQSHSVAAAKLHKTSKWKYLEAGFIQI